MRVRISYGTNIEDVPQELEQLFLFVSEKSHNTVRQVRQIEEFLADEDVESALNLIENNSEKKINTIQSIESSIIECINDKLKEDKSFKINLKNLQDLNISSYDIKKIGGIKAITNKIKNNKQIII